MKHGGIAADLARKRRTLLKEIEENKLKHDADEEKEEENKLKHDADEEKEGEKTNDAHEEKEREEEEKERKEEEKERKAEDSSPFLRREEPMDEEARKKKYEAWLKTKIWINGWPHSPRHPGVSYSLEF